MVHYCKNTVCIDYFKIIFRIFQDFFFENAQLHKFTKGTLTWYWKNNWKQDLKKPIGQPLPEKSQPCTVDELLYGGYHSVKLSKLQRKIDHNCFRSMVLIFIGTRINLYKNLDKNTQFRKQSYFFTCILPKYNFTWLCGSWKI